MLRHAMVNEVLHVFLDDKFEEGIQSEWDVSTYPSHMFEKF